MTTAGSKKCGIQNEMSEKGNANAKLGAKPQ